MRGGFCDGRPMSSENRVCMKSNTSCANFSKAKDWKAWEKIFLFIPKYLAWRLLIQRNRMS